MTNYSFLFLDPVDLGRVAAVTSSEFQVPLDGIEVSSQGVAVSQATGMPLVLVKYDPDFDGEYASFNAGEEFGRKIGSISEVEVASRLCKALGTRAMLAAENVASDAVWLLVASDGSSGLVLVDTDDLEEGVYTITAALQPIPGAPDIPVTELPEGFNPFRA